MGLVGRAGPVPHYNVPASLQTRRLAFYKTRMNAKNVQMGEFAQ